MTDMTDRTDEPMQRRDGGHRDPALPDEDASTNLQPAARSPEDPDRRGVLSDDEIVRDVEERRQPDEGDEPPEAERDAEFADATEITRSWHA